MAFFQFWSSFWAIVAKTRFFPIFRPFVCQQPLSIPTKYLSSSTRTFSSNFENFLRIKQFLYAFGLFLTTIIHNLLKSFVCFLFRIDSSTFLSLFIHFLTIMPITIINHSDNNSNSTSVQNESKSKLHNASGTKISSPPLWILNNAKIMPLTRVESVSQMSIENETCERELRPWTCVYSTNVEQSSGIQRLIQTFFAAEICKATSTTMKTNIF